MQMVLDKAAKAIYTAQILFLNPILNQFDEVIEIVFFPTPIKFINQTLNRKSENYLLAAVSAAPTIRCLTTL